MRYFYGFEGTKGMSAEGYERLIKCFKPLVERIEPPLSITSEYNEDTGMARFEVRSLLPDGKNEQMIPLIADNVALISMMIEVSK